MRPPAPHERDSRLAELLSLAPELDPEEAMDLLEEAGWDVAAAIAATMPEAEAEFREALRRSLVEAEFYSGGYGVPPAAAADLRCCSETKIFHGRGHPAGADVRCAVCLCDFAAGDELRSLGCGHCFHSKCVDQWLGLSAQCPVCKTPVGRS